MAFIRDKRDDHAWTISAISCSTFFFSGVFNDLPIFRLQTDYAHEFTVFKPDKKLKWLPHLGTVQLELQLEDRGRTSIGSQRMFILLEKAEGDTDVGMTREARVLGSFFLSSAV